MVTKGQLLPSNDGLVISRKASDSPQAAIRFVDLFAGIGGFHLALQSLGAECVFASEWDQKARLTYRANFEPKNPELFKLGNFAEDITLVEKENIPDFDLLTAGFPCQPFSNVGKKRGFEDSRGNTFFEIAEIIRIKQPKAYFLENVRQLRFHDGGASLALIRQTLTEELGYSFQEFVVKASDHGLPQYRPRLFLIGFRDPKLAITPPPKRDLDLNMSEVMGGRVDRTIGFTLRVGGRRSGISDRRNWDCYLVDGKEQLLTVEQAKLMQGFPKDFHFPVSDNAALGQLGNSVAINAVRDYAEQILSTLDKAQ